MTLLSLNSHVAYGYVGNAATTFALRRLGVEVWPVHTVDLAHHPGYGTWTGQVASANALRALIEGLAERHVFANCDMVLSGYLGAADQGAVVLDAVARVRDANPSARYILDPVMGDMGPGLYVDPAIARFFAESAVPRADVVTPNAFELGYLTGRPVTTLLEGYAAARALLSRGPSVVVATSLPLDGATLGVLAVTPRAGWLVRVPRLSFPVAPNGAGDLLAALLSGHLTQGAKLCRALGAAVNTVHGILEATAASARRELVLVGAQGFIAAPPVTLAVEAA